MADGGGDDSDEGPVETLRAMARLSRVEVVPAKAIAGALDLALKPTATPGCSAEFSVEAWALRVRPRLGPAREDRAIAHELVHLGLVLDDQPPPHDEAHVERLARALLLPRRFVVAALLEGGWRRVPERLAILPAITHREALLRAAEVLGRRVVIALPRERVASPPNAPLAWREHEIVQRIRRTRRGVRTLFGLEAWPVETELGLAVVIVCPEESEALRGW